MSIHAKRRHKYTVATLADGTATVFHRGNFPVKLGQERDGGNWGYWHNSKGYVASIPEPAAEADGCKPSHFGDLAYWSKFAADRCDLTPAGRQALRLARNGGRRECMYCYRMFRPELVSDMICPSCLEEMARNVDRLLLLEAAQCERGRVS